MALIVTQVGLAKAVQANLSGIRLIIAEVGIGTNGYIPNDAMTALQNEILRKPLKGAKPVAPNQIQLQVLIDDKGEIIGREIGFYLDDGTLFAIESDPNNIITYKSASNGSQALETFDLVLDSVPPDSVTVNVTGDLSIHEHDPNPHPQYERKDNAATNTDIDAESMAPKHLKLSQFWRGMTKKITGAFASRTINTTGALKGGGDLSVNRTLTIDDATTARKGAVQLSDSVTSASSVFAATAKAVKTAYDLAASKMTQSIADTRYLKKTDKAMDSGKLNGLSSDAFIKADAAQTPATAKSIPDNADLNTYQTPGLYGQCTNVQAENGANYPVPYAGSLEVLATAGLIQIYRMFGTSRQWQRAMYGDSWTAWTEFSLVGHSHPYLPLSGGELTGMLYARHFVGRGTGNDYAVGGGEVQGNGETNTIFPTFGFHQPSLYAGYIQLRGWDDFRFYQGGSTNYANVTAAAFLEKGVKLSDKYLAIDCYANLNKKGIVQLSDSVTSASSELAATSKAVKIAYEKALAAHTAVNNLDPMLKYTTLYYSSTGITGGTVTLGQAMTNFDFIVAIGGGDSKYWIDFHIIPMYALQNNYSLPNDNYRFNLGNWGASNFWIVQSDSGWKTLECKDENSCLWRVYGVNITK